MDFLSVKGIGKHKEKGFVLKDISFTQKRFQKIAIAGETGSGKSTLLKILAGLVRPDEGEVFFGGEKVLSPDEQLMPGHKSIAYLSQHFELRNNYRVHELLSMPAKLPEEETTTIYEVCRIQHLLQRKTNELSGGEKQRIATALLLSGSPRLLLLDEPFSNLDMMHKNRMKEVISDIGKSLQISSILISHDPLDTLSWADEILVMKDGQIRQQGTPEQVYRQPVDEYTAALFGRYNLLSPARASAFNIPANDNPPGKSLLVRPEGFTLSIYKNEGVKAMVHATRFFGSYYETEVFTGEDFITVKTAMTGFASGQVVNVSLLPDAIWYV